MNRPNQYSDVRLEVDPSAPQPSDRDAVPEAASNDSAAPLVPKPGFKLGRIPPERVPAKEGSDPDNSLPANPNQESTKEK